MKKMNEKKFLINWVHFFVDFFRDFFNDLFSFFATDIRRHRSSFDDDDVRWKTMESGDFIPSPG